jgi:bla regulator protein BlaR1
MDTFLQVVFSNVALSLLLAIIAFLVGMFYRRPQLAHLIWLVALVKLITPSMLSIPVMDYPSQLDKTIVTLTGEANLGPIGNVLEGTTSTVFGPRLPISYNFTDLLLLIWVFGSVIILAISLIRIWRFNRLLANETEKCTPDLINSAARISSQLGLRTTPLIYTTSANIYPMVWNVGGKSKVVMPLALIKRLSVDQVCWILSHELAHIRRRDHFVRWIEWITTVCFWWNPVVYWIRRNLRYTEELCCDALVIKNHRLKSENYANSLLNAFECLVSPDIQPPTIASQIRSGGVLKRRFAMILSRSLNRKTSRWMLGGVVVLALTALSLGICCSEGDNIAANPTTRETVSNSGGLGGQGCNCYDDMERYFVKRGVSAETIGRIKSHLKDNGITENQMQATLKSIRDIVREMISSPEKYVLNERIHSNLVKTGLTEKQVEMVVELSRMYEDSLCYRRYADGAGD